MAGNSKLRRPKEKNEDLLKLREAALELRVSFPTIKQWIYKRKIRSVLTAGGHHRIPQSEIDRLLFRTTGKTARERGLVRRLVSGRNQLVGRVDSVRISGLMAEISGHPDFPGLVMLRVEREPAPFAICSRQLVGSGVTSLTGKVRYVEPLEFESLLDRQANQNPSSRFVGMITSGK